jgi:hypothetical protein
MAKENYCTTFINTRMEILIYTNHIHMVIKYFYLISFMWIFHFQNHCLVLCHTAQTQEKHIPCRNCVAQKMKNNTSPRKLDLFT